MGQKADQSAFASTYRPDTQEQTLPPALPPGAPPLPPRNPALSCPKKLNAPPAYSEAAPIYHPNLSRTHGELKTLVPLPRNLSYHAFNRKETTNAVSC